MIRMAFWLGVVILLLPTEEGQQARIYQSAAAAVERAATFCDRNERVCETGSAMWATFVKKAEFAARMAYDLAVSRGRGEEAAPRYEPAGAKSLRPSAGMAPSRGTLRPDDLTPAWRGQRSGT
jgi:uncharacterized protein DUF5330